jgi:hypothetical protein
MDSKETKNLETSLRGGSVHRSAIGLASETKQSLNLHACSLRTIVVQPSPQTQGENPAR